MASIRHHTILWRLIKIAAFLAVVGLIADLAGVFR